MASISVSLTQTQLREYLSRSKPPINTCNVPCKFTAKQEKFLYEETCRFIPLNNIDIQTHVKPGRLTSRDNRD